jgi:hypothetical protein
MEMTRREITSAVAICFGKKPLGTKGRHGSIDIDRSHIQGKIELVSHCINSQKKFNVERIFITEWREQRSGREINKESRLPDSP